MRCLFDDESVLKTLEDGFVTFARTYRKTKKKNYE